MPLLHEELTGSIFKRWDKKSHNVEFRILINWAVYSVLDSVILRVTQWLKYYYLSISIINKLILLHLLLYKCV